MPARTLRTREAGPALCATGIWTRRPGSGPACSLALDRTFYSALMFMRRMKQGVSDRHRRLDASIAAQNSKTPAMKYPSVRLLNAMEYPHGFVTDHMSTFFHF